MSDARMTIYTGATYRRLTTWGLPGAPADYTAELIIRPRYDSKQPLLTLLSPADITMGGQQAAITANIRIGADDTAKLPPGQYVASMTLISATDPTENWVVNWPVTIRATTLVVE